MRSSAKFRLQMLQRTRPSGIGASSSKLSEFDTCLVMVVLPVDWMRAVASDWPLDREVPLVRDCPLVVTFGEFIERTEFADEFALPSLATVLLTGSERLTFCLIITENGRTESVRKCKSRLSDFLQLLI